MTTEFIGLPAGLMCRVSDVLKTMHIGNETWRLWKEAGLPTFDVGSDTEYVFSDDIHKFIRSRPKLGMRRSCQFKSKGESKCQRR